MEAIADNHFGKYYVFALKQYERGYMNVSDLKVVLADDLSVMRKILRTTLRNEGCLNFIEVASGNELLERVEKESVDLVIVDWDMPEVEGLELLKTLRKDKRYKTLPFIMIASEDNAKRVPAVLKTTRATYLTKPFQPDELMDKVKKVCKKRGSRKDVSSGAKTKKKTSKSTTKKASSKKKSTGTTKKKRKAKK